MVELVRKIAFREGIGDLLANGVKSAAEQIGQDSHKWAIEVKGLEQSRVETRSAYGYALAFAVNPRGPDHLMTETVAEFGFGPEAVSVIERITGSPEYANSHLLEKRPEIVRWHEDCYAASDALGFCVFTSTAAYGVTPKNMSEMFSAATGIPITEKELMLSGRRIITLEKCYNVREGADRKLDDLPWRLMNEPITTGSAKGLMNSKEELNRLLDRYYELHDWDLESSWPYRETLEKLVLNDVIEEFQNNNKLPKSRQ